MPNKAQEAYGTPNRQDQKRNSPHHVIEHPMCSIKQRLLKRQEKDQVSHKGRPTRITVHFPTETETQKELDPCTLYQTVDGSATVPSGAIRFQL